MKPHGPPLLLAALVAAAAFGDGPDEGADRRARENRDLVEQEFTERKTKFQDDADVLVERGLLANRKEKWVRIRAEATGMSAQKAVEFFLISGESGKGYEALATSFAVPSAVHRALEFIGMSPGSPVDPAALRFWPKGERLSMTFLWDGGEAAAEDLVVDNRTGKSLPRTGHAFVGSAWLPADGDDPEARVYAADKIEPNSIASCYNDPLTVIDLPRRGQQAELYDRQNPASNYVFVVAQPLEVLLRPTPLPNGRARAAELTLAVRPPPPAQSNNWQAARFAVTDADDRQLNAEDNLPAALAEFQRLADDGHDSFVAIDLDDGLPLGLARQVCAFLSGIENEQGIRIEPPVAGQLYYRAFLPIEKYRDRDLRPVQPHELHLTETANGLTGVVHSIDKSWTDEGDPVIEAREFPVASPADVQRVMADNPPLLPMLYAFASPDMAYGDLLTWLRPILSPKFTIYVYLAPPDSAPAAPNDDGS